MKASELRKHTAEDLQAKSAELEKELFNLRFQLHTGRLENSAKISSIRKEISQVKTIITEKQS
ncbi:MAG: 50S ribosomal protein L29 [Geobacteraceae bacterium]|nr:50S ribosomal protein L29 [Geobacteraceae bacterium]